MADDPPPNDLTQPAVASARAVDADVAESGRCHVFQESGSEEAHFSRETVGASARDRPVLLARPRPARRARLRHLSDVFRFHPLAVEDSEHFGQRAKIDDYDDFVFLVVYGAVARRRPTRRGALLLLRALPRHRPPRRLPGLRRDASAGTRSATSRSSTRRSSSTGSSTRSSTASSRSSPTSTTGSTSSRTRSSSTPTTSSSRRSSG